MRILLWTALALTSVGCATFTKKDVTGSGDERLDEGGRTAAPAAASVSPGPNCAELAKPDLVLLDARSADPLGCVLVTVIRKTCTAGSHEGCTDEVLFQGRTSARGGIPLRSPIGDSVVAAVAEGYVLSPRPSGAGPAEIEMAPEDGFLLKLIDTDGTYLTHRSVTFKRGEEVLAQMTSNALANVYFPSRTPFEGQPVSVVSEGFRAVTVAGPSDLGDDGHTVTLSK